MRVGLYVSTEGVASIDRILERFEDAEASGLDTAWVGHTFGWDALSLLALAGRVTRRIELGSWVVPSFPRHPVALTQQARTVQVAAGGRLTLGIGASHAAVIEKRMGLDSRRPLTHMQEVLEILPALLAGERVRHRGACFRVDVQLDSEDVPAPVVFVAALGPRMLELAGGSADGVAIWLGGTRFVADFALPRIDAGARSSNRVRPRVAVGLPIAVTTDRSARAAAERFLALSSRLPAYRRALEREGAQSPGEVAILGDETGVARRLEEIAELGVSDFNAIPVPIAEDPGAAGRTRRLLAEFAKSQRP